MNGRRFVMVPALVLATVLSATAAHADGFLTPFVGVNFGGSTNDKFVDAVTDNSKVNWGVALGYMGGGIIGFEEEISYTPKFFAPGIITGQVNVLTLISETESSPLMIEWPYSRSLRKKLVSPRLSDTAELIKTHRCLKEAVLR